LGVRNKETPETLDPTPASQTKKELHSLSNKRNDVGKCSIGSYAEHQLFWFEV